MLYLYMLFIIGCFVVTFGFSKSLFEEYLCVYEKNGTIDDIGCFLDDCPEIDGKVLYSSLRTTIKNCFRIRDGNYAKVPYCVYRCNNTYHPSYCMEVGGICPNYNDEGCPRFLGLLDFQTKDACEKYRLLDINEEWCILCVQTLYDLTTKREPHESDQYCQSGIPDELCVAAKYFVESDDDTEEELQRTALELCSKGRYDDPSYKLEKCSSYSLFPKTPEEDKWPLWIVILSIALLGFNIVQFICCLLLCTWCFDVAICFRRYVCVANCLVSCCCKMCLCCLGLDNRKRKDKIDLPANEEIESILYKNINGDFIPKKKKKMKKKKKKNQEVDQAQPLKDMHQLSLEEHRNEEEGIL